MKEDKLKAVIVDDEIHCIETLEEMIKKYCPELQISNTFTSSKDALLGLRESHADLLFLDVEMPWMNGLEMIQAMGKVNFKVIFTTAHNQYAIQAFRVSAIDYLLKPVNQKELQEAVAKVALENKDTNLSLSQLSHNLESKEINHRVAIPTKEGLDYILVESIIYCEAESNYTHIYTTDKGRILMSKPLKDIELQLKDYNFCRIHHSYMINLNHLVKYVRGNAGYVVMANKQHLNVSRSKKKELMDRLGVT